ncbi:Molybdopterin synthase catalytic subunit [bacterium HR36]|nr:Molybdopterin synthase catalytic subunit [bacterium HR36]
MTRLQREPIDYSALVETVRARAAGAVVVFLGTVREITGEQVTRALEYEAYAPLAEKSLAAIEAEMRQRWNLTEAVLVHRLGWLEPGEISVAVVVSAPHRHDAFLAARHAIERIKQIVPIWKKEHWADGSSQWIHPDGTVRATLPAKEADVGATGDT